MKTENMRPNDENEGSSDQSMSSEKGKNSLRCNIKLRPTPKMKWARNKRENIKNWPSSRKIMNESVRGWTKYPMKPLTEEYEIDQPL